jgi:hypothetical protein
MARIPPGGNVVLLSNILKSYCETDADKLVVSDQVNEMLADKMTESYIVASLAGSLLDGIRHGNWPWVIARINTTFELTKAQATVLNLDGIKFIGVDSKNRPVVEGNVGNPHRRVRWALLKNGDPTDVTEPVNTEVKRLTRL